MIIFRNDDFTKFDERAYEVDELKTQNKQLQMRLESLESMQAQLEENARQVSLIVFFVTNYYANMLGV